MPKHFVNASASLHPTIVKDQRGFHKILRHLTRWIMILPFFSASICLRWSASFSSVSYACFMPAFAAFHVMDRYDAATVRTGVLLLLPLHKRFKPLFLNQPAVCGGSACSRQGSSCHMAQTCPILSYLKSSSYPAPLSSTRFRHISPPSSVPGFGSAPSRLPVCRGP